MMVVDSVPAAHCGVWTMAPAKPPTHPGRLHPKGGGPLIQQRDCLRKVTQIVTPMPEVTEVEPPPLSHRWP